MLIFVSFPQYIAHISQKGGPSKNKKVLPSLKTFLNYDLPIVNSHRRTHLWIAKFLSRHLSLVSLAITRRLIGRKVKCYTNLCLWGADFFAKMFSMAMQGKTAVNFYSFTIPGLLCTRTSVYLREY
jgi:hypothetical protein